MSVPCPLLSTASLYARSGARRSSRREHMERWIISSNSSENSTTPHWRNRSTHAQNTGNRFPSTISANPWRRIGNRSRDTVVPWFRLSDPRSVGWTRRSRRSFAGCGTGKRRGSPVQGRWPHPVLRDSPDGDPGSGSGNPIHVKGIGDFRFRGDVDGQFKAIRIVKAPVRIWIQFMTEREIPASVDSRVAVGIDAGVKSRFTLSNGAAVPKRKLNRRKLRDRQQAVSRARKGSNSRRKMVNLLGKDWQRVRARRDPRNHARAGEQPFLEILYRGSEHTGNVQQRRHAQETAQRNPQQQIGRGWRLGAEGEPP